MLSNILSFSSSLFSHADKVTIIVDYYSMSAWIFSQISENLLSDGNIVLIYNVILKKHIVR